MIFQANLQGEKAEPYEGICCKACWNAKHEKCVCKCEGVHHGKGRPEKTGYEENALRKYYPSAQKYLKLITNKTCIRGHDISNETVWAYPNTSGWEVEETDELQWLYITCSECSKLKRKNDIALWKLGVSREATLEES